MAIRALAAVAAVVALAGLAAAIVLLRDSADDGRASRPVSGSVRVAVSAASPGGASSALRVEVDPIFDVQFPAAVPEQFLDDGMKDRIPTVYDPTFVAANESPLDHSQYVLGLVINGDARAYPLGLLSHSEMVNDVVGGIPVLVTW